MRITKLILSIVMNPNGTLSQECLLYWHYPKIKDKTLLVYLSYSSLMLDACVHLLKLFKFDVGCLCTFT